MSMKKQLLDPLGTACKLIALNFSEIRTKIRIHNHILTLDKPTNYQFAVRFFCGDGKENISELYYVIVRLIKWYLMPEYNKEDSNTNNKHATNNKHDTDNDDISINNYDNISINNKDDGSINNDDVSINSKENDVSINSKENDVSINSKENDIFEFVEKDGIDNAKAIGESDEIRKIVEYLCDALSKLQETYQFGNVILAIQFYINLLRSALKNDFDDSMLPNYILEKDKEFQNLLDYDKMKNFWDIKRLKRVFELYNSCFKFKDDDDDRLKKILIKSNLESLDSFLTDTDAEFQKLIQNSTRG